MAKKQSLSRLYPKDPSVTALLDLKDKPELSNKQPDALCSCIVDLENQWEEFSGWGEHPTRSTSNHHCIATSNSAVLPSSTSGHPTVHRTSSSHKQPRISGIGKSDSKSSIRSFLFEVQDITFDFNHYEGGDTSLYITKYKELHTYPTMQQRMNSGSSTAGSLIPLCSNCTHKKGGSQTSANLIKPKLVVLGEVNHRLYAAYPKPFRRRITSYKHNSEVLKQAEYAGVTKCAPVYRYDHKPGLQRASSASLVGDKNDSVKDTTKQKNDSARTGNHLSLSPFVKEETTDNKEPVMNVKWTSQSFPSFVVSSMNTSGVQTKAVDSQGIRKQTTSSRDQFSSQKVKGLNQHHQHRAASKPLHSLGTRSMPVISSSSGMATKSEFGHLLRHQTQVSFCNSRPGFRYETLCLQGHNAVKNSPPATVVGPWITTH